MKIHKTTPCLDLIFPRATAKINTFLFFLTLFLDVSLQNIFFFLIYLFLLSLYFSINTILHCFIGLGEKDGIGKIIAYNFDNVLS